VDADTDSEERPAEAPTAGTFKKIVLAPGRAMVGMHNLISRDTRKLRKGHWPYNVSAWICACIVWLVVILLVVLIVAAAIASGAK
jgi:uncharacterized membrane protein